MESSLEHKTGHASFEITVDQTGQVTLYTTQSNPTILERYDIIPNLERRDSYVNEHSICQNQTIRYRCVE